MTAQSVDELFLTLVAIDRDEPALEALCVSTLLTGYPVVDLVASRRPNLPDDLVSQARLDALTSTLRAVVANDSPLRFTGRRIDDGASRIAHVTVGDLLMLAAVGPEPQQVALVFNQRDDRDLAAVWRVLAPRDPDTPDLPDPIKLAAILLQRLRDQVAAHVPADMSPIVYPGWEG